MIQFREQPFAMDVTKYFDDAFRDAGVPDPADDERAHYVLDRIPVDVESILDVGSGTGIVARVVAERFDLTAVELSEVGVRALRSHGLKAMQGDIATLPFDDRSFELVMACEVLEHLTDQLFQTALLELQRVSGRYLLLTVPNQDYFPVLRQECPRCFSIMVPWGHVRSFREADLRHLFAEFQLLASAQFGPLVPNYQSSTARILGGARPWFRPLRLGNSCPACGYRETARSERRPGPADLLRNPGSLVGRSSTALASRMAPKSPRWLFALYERVRGPAFTEEPA